MTRLILLFISIGLFSSNVKAQSVINRSVVRKGTVPPSTVSHKNVHSYELIQLAGKWQEIKRIYASSNKRITFTDTLLLNFNKRDSVIVSDQVGISQKGAAEIKDNNQLEAAGDIYTITSLTNNNLLLREGEVLHFLKKRKLFYHETLGRIVIPKENLSEPVAVISKKLIGKWDIYRTQATPGTMETDSAIIKQIIFKDIQADGSLTGDVSFLKDGISNFIPFTSTNLKGDLIIRSALHNWNLAIYKANGKELVFGHHGGLVYFAKQLD